MQTGQDIVKNQMLTLRELNRATLEREMLLRRWELSAVEAIEQLVGMQAQAPKTALRRPVDETGGLPSQRTGPPDHRPTGAVRIALMRNTIHLITDRDCLKLRPLMQPVFDRGLYANRAHHAAIEGVDVQALVTGFENHSPFNPA